MTYYLGKDKRTSTSHYFQLEFKLSSFFTKFNANIRRILSNSRSHEDLMKLRGRRAIIFYFDRRFRIREKEEL